jgi:hypothetical protein
MYNANVRDTVRWRFEGIAAPQQQTTSTRLLSKSWGQALQQAYSFLPHDPVTAVDRLLAVRAELRRSAARGEQGALEWSAYADSLHESAETARSQWLSENRSRELQFRLREGHDSRTTVEGLRRPSATNGQTTRGVVA